MDFYCTLFTFISRTSQNLGRSTGLDTRNDRLHFQDELHVDFYNKTHKINAAKHASFGVTGLRSTLQQVIDNGYVTANWKRNYALASSFVKLQRYSFIRGFYFRQR